MVPHHQMMTPDRACESTSAFQGAPLCSPLLGEVLCIPASSLPQDPANEHPGSLIKLSFCLWGKKKKKDDLGAKDAESAICKGNSLETNSGGLSFAGNSWWCRYWCYTLVFERLFW